MDIDALVWLLFPFLVMVVAVVLIKVRPSASKPNRKNTAVGIVLAVTILAVYYFLRYVMFPE